MTTHPAPQLALIALSEAATPGPWNWRNRNGQIEIVAPHGGGTIVMGFVRDGHRGGQPLFGVSLDGQPRGKRGGVLRSAKELVAEDENGELSHPDALFIVAAVNHFRATQSRPEAELPELPESQEFVFAADGEGYDMLTAGKCYYTADQMRAYGQQCAATRPAEVGGE